MSELMNGYMLDSNGELTLTRKVEKSSARLKKKKLQEKQEAETKKQDQGNKEDSMFRMVKRVDGCGANKRKGEAAKVRKEFSLSKKERDKQALLAAEQKLSSEASEVKLDLGVDSTEDTRINRRKSKISLPNVLGKELLLALTKTKKKAGVLNK